MARRIDHAKLKRKISLSKENPWTPWQSGPPPLTQKAKEESLQVVKPIQDELSSYADSICQRIQNGTAEVDSATEKQQNYMTMLGIPYNDKTSKREAQKLISNFLEKRNNI
jgi:hypothetical protein